MSNQRQPRNQTNNLKSMNRERSAPPKQQPRSPSENERRAPERKIRSKKAAVYIAVAFIVAATAVLAGVVPLNQINIENNVRYSDEEIQKASGLIPGSVELSVNLKGAAARIMRELPYIQSAEVKRTSNGVTVTVAESNAKYALRQGNKYVLLGESMKVLEIGADKVPKDAFIVSGLEPVGVSAGQMLEAKNKPGEELLIRIVSLLSELKVNDITEINVSDVNNIELWYQNRLQLIMGSEEELEYNLLFAKETIKRENEVDPKQSGRFDFSEHGKAHFTPYIPTTIPETRPTETANQPSAAASQPTAAAGNTPAE